MSGISAPHRSVRLLHGVFPAAIFFYAVALVLVLATQVYYTNFTIILILAALGTACLCAAYVMRDGEPVSEEIALPVKAAILNFERRARVRQCESYGLLIVMLLLLIAAAWVFTNARAITTQDTGGDLHERLSTEKVRYDADVKKVDDLRGRALKK